MTGDLPGHLTVVDRMHWVRSRDFRRLTVIALDIVHRTLDADATAEFTGPRSARWTVVLRADSDGGDERGALLTALREARREWRDLP